MANAVKDNQDVFAQQRRYANEEDSIERIVPFSSIIDDGIVCTKNGDYVRTWRIEGMSFEGLSEEEVYSRMEALNLFIRGLQPASTLFGCIVFGAMPATSWKCRNTTILPRI